MKTKHIRILISSPRDVSEERDKAKIVIEQLQKRYVENLILKPVLWEDLPLAATTSFQQGIDLVLDDAGGIDIAVFILFSRLGTPLGPNILNPKDGSEYKSGTEREFDLMLRAYEKSNGKQPHILAYFRVDPKEFLQRMEGRSSDEQQEILDQRKLTESFVKQQFHDAERGFNIGAYYTFPKPIIFSHMLRTHLKDFLDTVVEHIAFGSWEGSPFRGLKVFDKEHEPIFYGRDDAICKLQIKLRAKNEEGCAFVLVVGASGSGKSSLVRAGVIPAVTEFDTDANNPNWRSAIFVPGEHSDDLCIGLVKVLASQNVLPELELDAAGIRELGEALAYNPQTTWKLKIRDAIKKTKETPEGKARILLVIDQMEELFTLPSITKGNREQFLKAIRILAQSGELWVIGTIRSDFYTQVQNEPILMEMKQGEGQYDLLLPTAAQLQAIICHPASLAGLTYERDKITSQTLDQTILDEAVKHPEAMPMLEFLLQELFENRSNENVLLIEEHKRLGGMEGAIGKRAESVFQSLPLETQAVLPAVLSQLVTLVEDDQESITRNRAPIAYFQNNPAAQTLISEFVDERLFVSDAGIITIVHEALLHNWDRAVVWTNENRDFLRIRHRITQSEKEWKKSGSSNDYLLSAGKPLADAENLLTDHGTNLETKLNTYITTSSEYQKVITKRRLRTLQWTTAAFGVLTILALLGFYNASQQKQLALKQEVTAREKTMIAIEAKAMAELEKKETQKQLTVAENNLGLVLAAKAEQALGNKQYNSAYLYALHSLQKLNPNLEVTTRAEMVGLTLRQGAFSSIFQTEPVNSRRYSGGNPSLHYARGIEFSP